MLPDLRLFLVTACVYTASLPANAHSAVAPQARTQNLQALVAAAQSFLLTQAASLPGKPVITVQPPANAGQLPACDAPMPFLAAGTRLRARLSVGVRCAAPTAWTVYLPAAISVPGTYYVAARTLHPGEILTAKALSPRRGDLITLPAGAVIQSASVLGQVVSQRVSAGQILRTRALRSAASVQRGQTVRIIARGTGFQVASEGQTMAAGSPGKPVPVRTASGQIITAIVQDAQTVEVPL